MTKKKKTLHRLHVYLLLVSSFQGLLEQNLLLF
jgi:hypothetical protein